MNDTTPARAVPPTGATASRSRLVTRRDIALFTEISGDRNPLHYDEELATASRFGGIVVQGGVTTAVLAKLAERGEIGDGERVVVVITGEGLKTLDATRDRFAMHEIDPDVESFESGVDVGAALQR